MIAGFLKTAASVTLGVYTHTKLALGSEDFRGVIRRSFYWGFGVYEGFYSVGLSDFKGVWEG